MTLELKILGALELSMGGQSIVPSAPKLRQILALLTIRSSTVVTVPEIIDEVWADLPPKSVSTTLQTYILQIRRILSDVPAAEGCGRAKGDAGGSIITYDGGYLFSAGGFRAARAIDSGEPR